MKIRISHSCWISFFICCGAIFSLAAEGPHITGTPIDTTNPVFGFLKVKLVDSNNMVVMNKCVAYLSSGIKVYRSLRDFASKDTILPFEPVRPGLYSLQLMVDKFPMQYYSPAENTINEIYKMAIVPYDTLTLRIRLTMKPFQNGASSISGIITSENNAPVADVKVFAIDTNALAWLKSINIFSFGNEFSAITNQTGNYFFNNIRTGAYIILAVCQSDNYLACFYPGVQLIAQAARIIVNTTSTTKIVNFSLKRGAGITGFVKDEAGNGIQNIRINLFSSYQGQSPQNNSFYYEVRTDSNGRFIFTGIPDGSWNIDVYDDNGFYFRTSYENELIKTSQNMSITLQKNILVRAGGFISGSFSPPSDSVNKMQNLGRMYIYPSNVTNFDSINTGNELWPYLYIGINTTSANYFKTSPLPEGSWFAIISPEIPYDKLNSLLLTQSPVPCFSWMFIDNALTLESSIPVQINRFIKVFKPITFKPQGFMIYGILKGDSGEVFGKNTLTNTFGKSFYVETCIKESRGFIRIGQSFPLDNSQFALGNFTADGREYYLKIWGENYRDQWWNGIADSSTCLRKNAKPYRFSPTNPPLRLYLKAKPEGWNENNNIQTGPSPVKNLRMKPVGLTSAIVTWSPSPPPEKVVRYKVYRIKDASESMFKKDDKGWWHPIEDSLKLKTLDSFAIADTSFLDTSIAAQIPYMYILFAMDINGRTGSALPPEIPLATYFSTITVHSFINTATVEPNNWEMFGLCGLDSQTMQTTTGDTKLFHWDPLSDSSKLFSHYQTISTLQPKQGAWIYSGNQLSFMLSDAAFRFLDKNKNSVTLSLTKGWNQIASPFPYTVTLSKIPLDFAVFEWAGEQNSYRLSKSFKPWHGYWIFSKEAAEYTISPLPAFMSLLNDTLLARNGEWQVQISLVGKTSSDPDNFIGVVSDQQRGLFSAATPKPPQAFDYPQLSLIQDEEAFCRYYYPSSDLSVMDLTWNIRISPTKEAADLVFLGIAGLPENISMFLLYQSDFIDLRKTNSLAIKPLNQPQYAIIVATTRPDALSLLGNSLALKQNFPNPFKRSTSFEFTIPFRTNDNGNHLDTKPRISLSVYTLSGRLVATVFSGSLKPGIHKKTWDGKNNSGRILPSGIYITQLKGIGMVKNIKMCKML